MEIIFHLGAHCTDENLLIRSILRNRTALEAAGIMVPGPLRYRELIGETSTRLRGDHAPGDTENMILAAICRDKSAHRIVLSNENFLCRSDVALGPDGLYPKAHKSAWLRQCLPSHEVEFALAIRNPAGFIPDLLSGRGGPAPGQDLLAAGVWLDDMIWSDTVARIAEANPECRIVVWCHEDTPFIWSEVMRELTGHDTFAPLEGEFDMLETIMTEDGMVRLTEFLAARDVQNQVKRRRAISAFLEAHAVADEIEEEIDLPGWTEETIQTLTELYEDDVSRISRMPEVTFISP